MKNKTWRLRFASYKNPDDIFKEILKGNKTIETRPIKAPGSPKNYADIKPGDNLLFCSVVSGREINKTVSFVHLYKSVPEMVKAEDPDKIFPGVKTADGLLAVYNDLKRKWGPKYKHELENYGIAAIGFI